MIIIFIYKGLCRKIVSVNNRDTKYTQINPPAQNTSAQLFLQLEIIVPSSIVSVDRN